MLLRYVGEVSSTHSFNKTFCNIYRAMLLMKDGSQSNYLKKEFFVKIVRYTYGLSHVPLQYCCL